MVKRRCYTKHLLLLLQYNVNSVPLLPGPPEQDEELGKIQAALAAGMTANAGHLQAYLKTWSKHRAIWEINKDPFIQRYQRLNPPVSGFDADIAR